MSYDASWAFPSSPRHPSCEASCSPRRPNIRVTQQWQHNIIDLLSLSRVTCLHVFVCICHAIVAMHFLFFSKFFVSLPPCHGYKRRVALFGRRFFFFLLFILTNQYICTYRFIYHHEWRTLPPPQCHIAMEGKDQWAQTVTVRCIFSFLFFIPFTTRLTYIYIGLSITANGECRHGLFWGQRPSARRRWGQWENERGVEGNAQPPLVYMMTMTGSSRRVCVSSLK